jgi:VanZ family protein
MAPDTREKLRLWLPVVLWALLIFSVSQIPNLKSPFGVRVYRKLAHLVEYFVLASLLARAFKGSGWRRTWWLWALGGACAFAASDEWHQHFVHGRHASFKDFELDSVGNALGLAAYGLWAA